MGAPGDAPNFQIVRQKRGITGAPLPRRPAPTREHACAAGRGDGHLPSVFSFDTAVCSLERVEVDPNAHGPEVDEWGGTHGDGSFLDAFGMTCRHAEVTGDDVCGQERQRWQSKRRERCLDADAISCVACHKRVMKRRVSTA